MTICKTDKEGMVLARGLGPCPQASPGSITTVSSRFLQHFGDACIAKNKECLCLFKITYKCTEFLSLCLQRWLFWWCVQGLENLPEANKPGCRSASQTITRARVGIADLTLSSQGFPFGSVWGRVHINHVKCTVFEQSVHSHIYTGW